MRTLALLLSVGFTSACVHGTDPALAHLDDVQGEWVFVREPNPACAGLAQPLTFYMQLLPGIDLEQFRIFDWWGMQRWPLPQPVEGTIDRRTRVATLWLGSDTRWRAVAQLAGRFESDSLFAGALSMTTPFPHPAWRADSAPCTWPVTGRRVRLSG